MGLFNTGNQFPYTNFHDLNLDWILQKMKELIEDWAKLRSDWDNYQLTMNSAWATYKSDTDADLAAYKANLTGEWTAYQVQNNAEFQAFKSGIEARQDDFEQQFRDLKQFVIDYFDNVDWEQMLNDLMNEWYSNGTLIRLIAPYLPFVTPEMYGAVGDGVADDSGALNQLMTAGVNNHRAVWFSPNTTFRIAAPVEITGTIDIHGNGATVEADAGVSGLVFTAPGPESTIDNLTINSRNSRWPAFTWPENDEDLAWIDPADKGVVLSGEHMKVSRINVNNFTIGIFYDERIAGANVNQTGVILNNIHVRYCNCGARLGYTPRNGRTTDYTITDCTFAASWIPLYITDAIGYFISNVHTWSPANTVEEMCKYGMFILNCSITTLERCYVEPAKEYAAYIHTRKGLNITDFVYVCTFDYRTQPPRVFYFNGSRGYRVNLNSVEIRPGTPDYDAGKPYVKPILIHQGMGGIFNIGNVITSELIKHTVYNPTTEEDVTIDYASILPGVAYDLTDQSYGYFYTNNSILQLKSNPYIMQINGKMVEAAPYEIYLPYNETDTQTGSVTIDMSQIEAGRPVYIDVYTTGRDVADNVSIGRYSFGALVKGGTGVAGDVVVSSVNNILNDASVSLSLDTSVRNKLKITASQTAPQYVNDIIINVKYVYFAPSNTPETNPYV